MSGLCPTAPVTPERPGQSLYGFGGGDAPTKQRRGQGRAIDGSRIFSTVRLAHNRRYGANGSPGSPLRPRGVTSARSRPLERALPAPIPLCDYSPPTRVSTSLSSDYIEPPPINLSPIALGDFLEAPSSPPLLSPGVERSDLTERDLPFVASAGDSSADDLSDGIALAVLAAVNQTIHDEVLSQEAAVAACRDDLERDMSAVDGSAATTAMGVGIDYHAEDGDSQETSAPVDAPSGATYVPPSSPLAPLFWDDSMPVSSTEAVWYDQNGGNLSAGVPAFLRRINPLTYSFFGTCHIATFNPRRPTYTSFDLLMRIGSRWGWSTGVTRTELKQMLRTCSFCERFMYAERRAQHRCDCPGIDVLAPQFDFVSSMLSFTEHSGFSLVDLSMLLSRCNDCQRILHIRPDVINRDSPSVHRCPRAAAADDLF